MSAQKFHYTPLRDTTSQIRLLKLHPAGRRFARIECDLIIIDVQNSDLIPYEALSYAWGLDSSSQTINVNNRTLKIGSDLHIALSYLRLESTPRILWIDALCIDQSNSQEKGHQIRQMCWIYQSAVRVVVWLGITDIRVERAVDMWLTICPLLDLAKAHEGKSKIAKDMVGKTYSSLQAIFDARWWTRIWVIQEVALPHQPPLVMFRSRTIPYDVLEAIRSSFASVISLRSLAIESRKLPYNWRPLSVPIASRDDHDQVAHLSYMLQATAGREATEPRDKVFGLLGPFGPSIQADFSDYNESLSITYQKASVYLFSKTPGMIMYTCPTLHEGEWNITNTSTCHPRQTQMRRTSNGIELPSWCIDFSYDWITHAQVDHIPGFRKADRIGSNYPPTIARRMQNLTCVLESSHPWNDDHVVRNPPINRLLQGTPFLEWSDTTHSIWCEGIVLGVIKDGNLRESANVRPPLQEKRRLGPTLVGNRLRLLDRIEKFAVFADSVRKFRARGCCHREAESLLVSGEFWRFFGTRGKYALAMGLEGGYDLEHAIDRQLASVIDKWLEPLRPVTPELASQSNAEEQNSRRMHAIEALENEDEYVLRLLESIAWSFEGYSLFMAYSPSTETTVPGSDEIPGISKPHRHRQSSRATVNESTQGKSGCGPTSESTGNQTASASNTERDDGCNHPGFFFGRIHGQALPGDHLVGMHGMPCPILLRPKGDSFLVCGPTYVPQVMNDEYDAIEPLPRFTRDDIRTFRLI